MSVTPKYDKLLCTVREDDIQGNISHKIIDLEINAGQLVVAGNSFTPPIIREPSVLNAIQINAPYGVILQIIDGFVQNGAYYDILISPQDQQLLNVKISVI